MWFVGEIHANGHVIVLRLIWTRSSQRRSLAGFDTTRRPQPSANGASKAVKNMDPGQQDRVSVFAYVTGVWTVDGRAELCSTTWMAVMSVR